MRCPIQWNLSNEDTLGAGRGVLHSGTSLLRTPWEQDEVSYTVEPLY